MLPRGSYEKKAVPGNPDKEEVNSCAYWLIAKTNLKYGANTLNIGWLGDKWRCTEMHMISSNHCEQAIKKNVKLYQQMKKHLYLKILSKTVLKFP